MMLLSKRGESHRITIIGVCMAVVMVIASISLSFLKPRCQLFAFYSHTNS